MHVIITGASRGIGFALAKKFASFGHTLYITAKNEIDLYNSVLELQKLYPNTKIHAYACDITNKVALQAFANWCIQFNEPDILINNAGIFIPGQLLTQDENELQNLLQINLLGAFNLTRFIVPEMKSSIHKNKHIFNICSIASIQPYTNGGAYSISKFALYGFSKNLREELKMEGIKVTHVLPGAVFTDSWKNFDNTNERIMVANDVAEMVYSASQLSFGACVEEIILRPQLGDL